MMEKKLKKLLQEANELRQKTVDCKIASYYYDIFLNLNKFLSKKLNSKFYKNKNINIIVNHFDEILPFITMANIDILIKYSGILVEYPNFKNKFIDGLKNYPYKEEINLLFYNIYSGINDFEKFNNFIDNEMLQTISTLNLNSETFLDIINILNEENQKIFLKQLVENKCNIPYGLIQYKGNNKQIIYDNLQLFTKNSKDLYRLLDFVKENQNAYNTVKEYMDNNIDEVMNSILTKLNYRMKIENKTIKETIKLLILDVIKNENIKASDILYNEGGFSYVLIIGDKVIKLGEKRATKEFPNNPYIVSPLLRKNFEIGEEKCFVEITERVDTNTKVSNEELYQLYKKIRNLGLMWTDIKETNVGRLRKENIIHWNKQLEPSDETLGLQTKRGNVILKEGDLVILDADFLYDEDDLNINYSNNKEIRNEFEKRYQREKIYSINGEKSNIIFLLNNIIQEENNRNIHK